MKNNFVTGNVDITTKCNQVSMERHLNWERANNVAVASLGIVNNLNTDVRDILMEMGT